MKFSNYNIFSKTKDNKVLINLRTSQWVKVNTQEVYERIVYLRETNNFDMNNPTDKALYDRGFIVDDDFNEYEDLKVWWEKSVAYNNRNLHVMTYVTDQCNFRCIYCPEEHVSRHLSDEHWEGLYNYIKNRLEKNELDIVTVCFFGGEPLLESKKILGFLEKLEPLRAKYKDVVFKHEIVTNGYLLTSDLYKKLNDYGLHSYQITVDGFKETHDKNRPRVDGSGTWDVIIENLKNISETNDTRAKILFRTNNNDEVSKNLDEFYKWATETFTSKNFIFDLQGVAKFSESVSDELLQKEDVVTITKNYEIYKEYKERMHGATLGILSKGHLACRVSNKNAFSIFTDGSISKCEAIHMGNKTIVGKLQQDGTIEYNCDIEKWYTDMEYSECESCIQYPLCGARNCPYKRMISEDGHRLDCSKYDEENFYERVHAFVETSGVFDR